MITLRNSFLPAALLVIASSSPAYAYLDPGTGSIVLQAIIGGIAASLYIMRGYYHRVRGWFGLGERIDRGEKAHDE